MRKLPIEWLSKRYLPCILALIAMALALPCLWTGLLTDDYVHRMILQRLPLALEYFRSPLSMFVFLDGNPERTREFIEAGIVPWWTIETVRLAFWRPLSAVTYWLDYRLWPNCFPLMHLHSMVWFGAVAALATVLYRRLMGAGCVAGLAGLLYAIDDAHAMPVTWLANRHALLAVFWGLLAILVHDRWRRDGKRAAAFFAPVFLLLGLLSNEGAIAVCAYLFAYAVFVDRGRWLSRALTLVPYGVVVVGWRVLYSSLGYGASGSAGYVDPLGSPLRFAEALWVRGPLLFLGQWALPPSDLFLLWPPPVRFVISGAALFLLIVLLGVLMPLLRRDAVARFWCLGTMLALVPCCSSYPTDGILLFVGIGAMGLLAQFIGAMRTGTLSSPNPSALRSFTRPLYIVFIIVHLIFAPLFLPLKICAAAAIGGPITACIDNAPLNESVADQSVIIANAPNCYYATYLHVMRALKGEPRPARVRHLGPNNIFSVPTRLTRTDARTILVEPEGGFPMLLFRDKDHPLAVGQKIELTAMSAEVMTLTVEGWPLEVRYRFDVPLEDPSLVWLEFQGRRCALFTPPAVGESAVLNE